jgi:type IV pilus assembly protein PilY1
VWGTTDVGLRLGATGHEGLAHGSPSEGWGVGVATLGVSGWANQAFGPVGGGPVEKLGVTSFVATAGEATSTVQLPAADGTPLLETTHAFRPSASPHLFQVDVTIRNVSAITIGDTAPGSTDLRYRRTMDWDVEPTVSEDYVTITGHPATHVILTSDDGFEVPDPLRFEFGFPRDFVILTGEAWGVESPVGCGFTTDFTRCGEFMTPFGFPLVADHGALFDLGFPGLAPGEARTFTLFYGAAPTVAEADLALAAAGAEMYSYAHCRPWDPVEGVGDPRCDPVTGSPNTFIFGLKHVGGLPVFGAVSGTVFSDLDADGVYLPGSDTPLAGVTVTLAGTDASGAAVSRTVTTDASGAYTFAALRAGSYAVAAPEAASGGTLVTPSPQAVTLSRAQQVTGVDFAYVLADMCHLTTPTITEHLDDSFLALFDQAFVAEGRPVGALLAQLRRRQGDLHRRDRMPGEDPDVAVPGRGRVLHGHPRPGPGGGGEPDAGERSQARWPARRWRGGDAQRRAARGYSPDRHRLARRRVHPDGEGPDVLVVLRQAREVPALLPDRGRPCALRVTTASPRAQARGDCSDWRSRRERVTSRLCVSLGTLSRSVAKSRRWMVRRRMGVSATTVAERGPPSSRLISPKYSPGPSFTCLRGDSSTRAVPSRMRKNSSPASPTRVR